MNLALRVETVLLMMIFTVAGSAVAHIKWPVHFVLSGTESDLCSTLDSRIVTRTLTGLERRPDSPFTNAPDTSCDSPLKRTEPDVVTRLFHDHA